MPACTTGENPGPLGTIIGGSHRPRVRMDPN